MKKTTIACIVTAVVVLGCALAIGAATYVGVPKGQIYQAYVTYSDSDTIIIKPGYGECNGHYWENTSDLVYDVNYIPAGEDFIYIYIDDDESDYPYPTICDSITEPVWSDSKLGWYNGDDRCIGVVWTPSTGATLTVFSANSSQRYALHVKTVLSGGNPTGSWIYLAASSYIPVNAIATRIYASNTDTDGSLDVELAPYGGGVNGVSYSSMGYYTTRLIEWMDLARNGSRDLQWYGFDDDDNSFFIAITGYQIER